jgi:TetR/AcrR family transcriptional regulator, cholesterol catabolism regulator
MAQKEAVRRQREPDEIVGVRGRRPAGSQYRERHQEIVRAAARLFAERGFDATSIADIADEVGLLKGSLYYYVPNKQDLLFAMIAEVQRAGREITDRFMTHDGDPVTQLRSVIEAGAHFLIEHRDMSIVSLRDFRSLSEDRQQELRKDRSAIWTCVKTLIERARDQGDIGPEIDIGVATSAIVGALNHLPTWYVDGRAPNAGRMARGYATFLVDGLGVRRSS